MTRSDHTPSSPVSSPSPAGGVREALGKLDITQEWFEKRARAEGDLEVSAGAPEPRKSITGTINPSPEQIAEYERLAFEALPQWARNEITRLRALSSPATGEVVDEMGRDDLRRRAKTMLKRNGWEPGNQFSAHSTVELMVSLAIDAVRTPPDRCGWPECGCCHDASCGGAALNPAPGHGEGGL